jgi:NADH-quinone oxidoreductase subunit H
MMTCLKYFLPISCGLLLGVCAWLLYVPRPVGETVRMVLALGSLAFVLAVGASLLRARGFAPPGELPGAWGGAKTPLMRK